MQRTKDFAIVRFTWSTAWTRIWRKLWNFFCFGQSSAFAIWMIPTRSLLRSRCENATPNLCWVSCALLGFVEIAFVVDTHLPRFEALAYVLPHFDALTHVVIRVSSAFIFQTFAEVCYSVFVNRSSFKSVLNLRKAYIGVAEGLL